MDYKTVRLRSIDYKNVRLRNMDYKKNRLRFTDFNKSRCPYPCQSINAQFHLDLSTSTVIYDASFLSAALSRLIARVRLSNSVGIPYFVIESLGQHYENKPIQIY